MINSMRTLACSLLTFFIFGNDSYGRPAGVADDFVPLFNGRDFSGWTNVNCAPSTWSVREGMIYCTGIPTGVLRTIRPYENFICEIEWKHMRPGGNSGIFVWSDALTAPGQPFTRAVE